MLMNASWALKHNLRTIVTFLSLVENWRSWMVNAILIRICELLPAALMNTYLRHVRLNAENVLLGEGNAGGWRERLLTLWFRSKTTPTSQSSRPKAVNWQKLLDAAAFGRIPSYPLPDLLVCPGNLCIKRLQSHLLRNNVHQNPFAFRARISGLILYIRTYTRWTLP